MDNSLQFVQSVQTVSTADCLWRFIGKCARQWQIGKVKDKVLPAGHLLSISTTFPTGVRPKKRLNRRTEPADCPWPQSWQLAARSLGSFQLPVSFQWLTVCLFVRVC